MQAFVNKVVTKNHREMAGIVVVLALLYGVSAQDRGQERKGGSSV